jgi:hypothetical protein
MRDRRTDKSRCCRRKREQQSQTQRWCPSWLAANNVYRAAVGAHVEGHVVEVLCERLRKAAQVTGLQLRTIDAEEIHSTVGTAPDQHSVVGKQQTSLFLDLLVCIQWRQSAKPFVEKRSSGISVPTAANWCPPCEKLIIGYCFTGSARTRAMLSNGEAIYP